MTLCSTNVEERNANKSNYCCHWALKSVNAKQQRNCACFLLNSGQRICWCIFLHPMFLPMVWLNIDRPTTLTPFQIPSGLWKPALVCRLPQNEILFLGDVNLSHSKHSSALYITGFSQFNKCVVCVTDASPNPGTHFVRRARIERTNIASLQTPLPVHPRVPGVGREREAKKPSSKCESYGAVFSWQVLRLKQETVVFLMNFNAERVSSHSLQSYFTVLVLQLKHKAYTRLSVAMDWHFRVMLSKYYVTGHFS